MRIISQEIAIFVPETTQFGFRFSYSKQRQTLCKSLPNWSGNGTIDFLCLTWQTDTPYARGGQKTAAKKIINAAAGMRLTI